MADYALQRDTLTDEQLESGVLRLLAIAVGVALLSRLALQGSTLSLLRQSILFMLLWLIFRNMVAPAIDRDAVHHGTDLQAAAGLGNIVVLYREADASLQTYDALMHRPIETGPVDHLRLEHVVFRHRDSATNAIDGLSLEARSSDTIAFVGPSGSGKSTLLALLVGLYQPVSGEIYYTAYPRTTSGAPAVRRRDAGDPAVLGDDPRESALRQTRRDPTTRCSTPFASRPRSASSTAPRRGSTPRSARAG